MKPHGSPRLEKLLVVLLTLPFLVPLPLTLLVRLSVGRGDWAGVAARALLGRSVVGEKPVAPPVPAVSAASLRDASYQEGLAANFNLGFGAREWVIRATEEAYLRLFHTTSAGIVFGRGGNAFYNEPPFAFVDEYCVERQPPDTLRPLVEGLRAWRDSCLSRGVGFALLITPTKASIYPEDLPAAWRHRQDPRPRNYVQFLRLLRQAGLNCIDGHALTRAAKAHAPSPVFPLGGTHWSQYASLLTANAVLAELQSQGQPVRPIEDARPIVSENPSQEDADMLGTADPFVPWRFPVVRMDYPPVPLARERRPSLVLIGGSFLNSLGAHLFASAEFSEVHWLRYYQAMKELAAAGDWRVLAADLPAVDVEKEVFGAQCVVLEVNEQQLIQPEHLRLLFADSLARLPARGAPPSVFSYELSLPCRWGEPIPFNTPATFARTEAFSGFSSPEPPGCPTDGPEATVSLTLPSVEQDVTLTAGSGAIIVPGKLPRQRVGVFANGQPVAEWAFDEGGYRTNTAVIPRAALRNGQLVLRFHFSQTISPAQVDGGPGDVRQLAWVVQQLTLRQNGRRVDGPVFSAAVAAPGQPDSVYAAGFSRAGTGGRWTVGPGATLRLPSPVSGSQDTVFSAEVAAMLDPVLLPVQRTDIFVNGRSVGEWIFAAPGVRHREILVPRALLTGGSEEVQLRFSGTLSSAQAGRGTDERRLALQFKSVQFHGFAAAADPPAAPPPHAGGAD